MKYAITQYMSASACPDPVYRRLPTVQEQVQGVGGQLIQCPAMSSRGICRGREQPTCARVYTLGICAWPARRSRVRLLLLLLLLRRPQKTRRCRTAADAAHGKDTGSLFWLMQRSHRGVRAPPEAGPQPHRIQ